MQNLILQLKTFSVFDTIGQSMTLIGSGFFLYDGVVNSNLNVIFGSFLLGCGQISMIVNSCYFYRKNKGGMFIGRRTCLKSVTSDILLFAKVNHVVAFFLRCLERVEFRRAFLSERRRSFQHARISVFPGNLQITNRVYDHPRAVRRIDYRQFHR